MYTLRSIHGDTTRNPCPREPKCATGTGAYTACLLLPATISSRSGLHLELMTASDVLRHTLDDAMADLQLWQPSS